MLTVALALLALLLLVAIAAAALRIRDLVQLTRAQLAELDALSIAGRKPSRPVVDTATGSHDHIPMRDDIRHMVADYCEGMWHHTTDQP